MSVLNSCDQIECDNEWDDWGRWVLFAALVALALLFVFIFS